MIASPVDSLRASCGLLTAVSVSPLPDFVTDCDRGPQRDPRRIAQV